MATEDEVRALLVRHKCPVPFHEVRTRFLGNIATPDMAASPIKIVESLWGGELPEFDSIEAANELIGALVMGLWNRLSRHQERNTPFRLTRPDVAATRERIAAVALMRRQELDGFIEGLFGSKETLDLPERAHRGLDELAEIRALFAAVLDFAADETKPGTGKEMATTLRHMREMTKNAEHEMNAVVLSCTRARRQMLAALPAKKPTLH
ncbi:MAG: hypothetical protein O3A51_07830 [Verrucomicrobia bacterium]|nr:hypothetical protein [Verrucomicrobiota bacterium]